MEGNTAVCVGTFDRFGMPIAITKHLSDCATVAFQTITLNLLLAHAFKLEAAKTTIVRCTDGSHLRIDRTLKGFTGYVGTTEFESSNPSQELINTAQ